MKHGDVSRGRKWLIDGGDESRSRYDTDNNSDAAAAGEQIPAEKKGDHAGQSRWFGDWI